MEVEPRERERHNLKQALADFVAILDAFEARIQVHLRPEPAKPVLKCGDRNFAIDVVTAFRNRSN
ncbi:hypothetical protein [Bradyrhizobium ganzhouense]|uniref:hypothetical protein n=1 Tax=Bradyrhizobium ganzhouense TaxID=1179767 RepID=UPI003CF82BA9